MINGFSVVICGHQDENEVQRLQNRLILVPYLWAYTLDIQLGVQIRSSQ